MSSSPNKRDPARASISVSPSANPAASKKKEEGNAKYSEQKYDEAVAKYSEAIALDPTNAAFYGNRAAAYIMLQEWEKALNDSETAFKLDSKFAKAYERGARSCLQLGKLDQAELLIEKLLELDEKVGQQLKDRIQSITKSISKAKAFLEGKEYSKALGVLQSILEHTTKSIQVKLLQAEGLLGMRRYDEARAVCDELLSLDSRNPDIIHLRGVALYYSGNHSLATKHFQQVLGLDPDCKKSRDLLNLVKKLERTKEMGNEAFKNSKWQEAFNYYTECLTLDPQNDTFNSTLYCNRAGAFTQLKQYKEAKEDCDRALELNPNYTKAYLRRATCQLELEDFDASVRDYESAKRLDPANEDIDQQIRSAKLEAKKAKRKDYYKILGVTKTATESEIKKAYRKSALVWHPDKWSGKSEEEKKTAETKFKDITEAYGVLSDAEKRRQWDSGADLEDVGGVDLDDVVRMFFGGGGGGFMFGGPGGGGARFARAGGGPRAGGPRGHSHFRSAGRPHPGEGFSFSFG